MASERIILGLALAAMLAACGVDGPPLPPEPREQPASRSLTLDGRAEIGLSGGT